MGTNEFRVGFATDPCLWFDLSCLYYFFESCRDVATEKTVTIAFSDGFVRSVNTDIKNNSYGEEDN